MSFTGRMQVTSVLGNAGNALMLDLLSARCGRPAVVGRMSAWRNPHRGFNGSQRASSRRSSCAGGSRCRGVVGADEARDLAVLPAEHVPPVGLEDLARRQRL